MKKDKKKLKIISLVLACCFVLSFALALFPINKFVGNSASADWKDHSASQLSKKNGWYEISTAEELACLRVNIHNYYNKNIKLTNDINLWVDGEKQYYWSPIPYFEGTFDGGGHTINGMKVVKNSGFNLSGKKDSWKYYCGGLFSYVGENTSSKSNAVVQNIIFKDCSVVGNSYEGAVGIVAGVCEGTIQNVVLNNCSINTYSFSNQYNPKATNVYIGGIVGLLQPGDNAGALVERCKGDIEYENITNTITIANEDCTLYFGGIAGYATGQNVKICLSYSSSNKIIHDLAKKIKIGGIAGGISSDVTVEECFNGGIVSGGTVQNNIISKKLSTKVYAGGIVGESFGSIKNCYNIGEVISQTQSEEIIKDEYGIYSDNYIFADGAVRFLSGGKPGNPECMGTFNSGIYTYHVYLVSLKNDIRNYDYYINNEYNSKPFQNSSVVSDFTTVSSSDYQDKTYLSGKFAFAGGIVGYKSGIIEQCYNTGKISGGKINFVEETYGRIANTNSLNNEIHSNLIIKSTKSFEFRTEGAITGFGGSSFSCYDASQQEFDNSSKVSTNISYFIKNEEEHKVSSGGIWYINNIGKMNAGINLKLTTSEKSVDGYKYYLTCIALNPATHYGNTLELGHFRINENNGVSPLTKYTKEQLSTVFKSWSSYWCIGDNGYPILSQLNWKNNFVNSEPNNYYLKFEKNSTGAKLVDYTSKNLTPSEIIIPEEVNIDGVNYDVTEIGDSVFANTFSKTLDYIKEISIPNTVTKIGKGAFSGCDGLTSITLPDNLISIDVGAFSVCDNLETVKCNLKFNSSVSSGVGIGQKAFYSCPKLKVVNLPKGINSIGESAFESCAELTYVQFAGGYGSIGKNAFKSCVKLTDVVSETNYSNGSTYVVEEGAFNGCKKLVNVKLSSGISGIGKDAFNNCVNLQLKELPINTRGIGSGAFKGCAKIELTKLPDKIVTIADHAFEGCTLLNLKSLPSGVTYIDEYAFADCKNITLTTLPTGITSVNNYVFKNCSNLALTSLSDSITKIGEGAFYGCSNLEIKKLPKNITYINNYAFYGCTNLSLTSLNEETFGVGDNAFAYCYNLSLTSFPKTLSQVGKYAFAGCSSVKVKELPNEMWYIGAMAFMGSGIQIKSLPNKVKVIESSAFSSCNGITEITIDDNVYRIDNSAFSGCENLEKVVINQDIEKMREFAIYEYYPNHPNFGGSPEDYLDWSTESLIYPDMIYAYNRYANEIGISGVLTDISYNTFYGCSKLTEISLPITILIVDDNAFSYCTSLEEFPSIMYLEELGTSVFEACENLKWAPVVTWGLNKIASRTFYGCKNLISVDAGMGNALEEIGSYAFYGCESLTGISTSNGVLVYDYAFYGCSSLNSFYGAGYIGSYAFYGCTALTYITLYEYDIIIPIGKGAFYGCENFTIYNYDNSAYMTLSILGCGSSYSENIHNWSGAINCIVVSGINSTRYKLDEYGVPYLNKN